MSNSLFYGSATCILNENVEEASKRGTNKASGPCFPLPPPPPPRSDFCPQVLLRCLCGNPVVLTAKNYPEKAVLTKREPGARITAVSRREETRQQKECNILRTRKYLCTRVHNSIVCKTQNVDATHGSSVDERINNTYKQNYILKI